MKARVALLACALLAACSKSSDELTQVMVVIDAEPGVRAQTKEVDVEVRTGSGDVSDWERRLLRNITPGRSIEWPLEIGLVPRGGDADRVYLAVATARDESGEAVAEVRAISGYRRGETLTLLLLFEEACLGRAEICGQEQTCRSGDCVDAHVAIGDLPEYRRDDAGNPVLAPFWDGGLRDAGGGDGGGAGGTSGSGGTGTVGQDCNDHADCDDDDPCSGAERCDQGACVAGEPFECEHLADPCRTSVCVDDDGEPRCEEQDANEGQTCRAGDASDEPAESCAFDYVCVAGACEPQSTQTCDPSQCQVKAGCDPDTGCVFDSEPDTTSCDDGDLCTEDDHCTGTDGTCTSEPKDCDDGVDCTDDSCDDTGACVNTAADTNCDRPCQTGTCHATMDCQYTSRQDFTECDDARAATTPDFCYQGQCVGGTRGPPAASCAVGGCGCTGFTLVKDLDYVNNTYVGLIDATQTGAPASCRQSETITIVYEVTPSMLTAYTINDVGGARWEEGSDLANGYAVSLSNVGILDTAARSVEWFSNPVQAALASTSLIERAGIARVSTGPIVGRTTHLWIWGNDGTTPTTGKIVHCSWTACQIDPCTDPAPSCAEVTSYTTRSVTGVSPYTSFAALSSSYAGAVSAVNFDSGATTRGVYSDGAGKDYVPATLELGHTEGVWAGTLLVPGTGQVLMFGNGATNLARCDDSAADGDPACAGISGLPNQASRSFFDGAVSSSGAVFLLASSCTSLCVSSSYYLYGLPAGADPTVGSNWQQYFLGTWNGIGGSGGFVANDVAAGGNTIMVLGESDDLPYVWSFGP